MIVKNKGILPSLGSAHGRFQVFHNEHLEYLLKAKNRCKHLLVGLTAYDLSYTDSQDRKHRRLIENNPLSYYERQLMVRSALQECGVALQDFSIVPFPIEHPSDLPNFIPRSAICYTTIKEAWNTQKIERLEQAGYQVEILIEGPKAIEGVVIRQMIADGNEKWREFVPPSTARLVEELDLATRLRKLINRAL